MAERDQGVAGWATQLRTSLGLTGVAARPAVVTEPPAEATPEPVAEAAPEPIAEAAPEPASEAAAEPVAEAAPEVAPEPAPAIPPPAPDALLSFLTPMAPPATTTAEPVSPLLSALGLPPAAEAEPKPAIDPAAAAGESILSSMPVLRRAPRPAAAEPAPAAVEPLPAEEPAPVAEAPEPVAEAPAPVAEEPAPEPPAEAPEAPLLRVDPPGDAAISAAALTGSAAENAPQTLAARQDDAESMALANSQETATGSWSVLLLGSPAPDILLAGPLAARRRGLTPVLHAVEPAEARFNAMYEALEAEDLADGETRLLQAAVGVDPAKVPARGALARDLIGRLESWDLVRVTLRGLIPTLLSNDTPLLSERVRWLLLVTHNRSDEFAATKRLHHAGWSLKADRPAELDLNRPNLAVQTGMQLWRGPKA